MLAAGTRVAYTALVGLVGLQRLGEVTVSRRHERALAARGGREWGATHYPVMVVLHAAFLLAAPAEVWLLARPLVPWLAGAMLAVVAAAMAVRLWTMRALGDRWCTRVVVVPGEAPVTDGPYRYLRHPNYAAVAAELVALPLVHGAWLTAAAFSVANAWLLRARIRVEDAALGRTTGGGR